MMMTGSWCDWDDVTGDDSVVRGTVVHWYLIPFYSGTVEQWYCCTLVLLTSGIDEQR